MVAVFFVEEESLSKYISLFSISLLHSQDILREGRVLGWRRIERDTRSRGPLVANSALVAPCQGLSLSAPTAVVFLRLPLTRGHVSRCRCRIDQGQAGKKVGPNRNGLPRKWSTCKLPSFQPPPSVLASGIAVVILMLTFLSTQTIAALTTTALWPPLSGALSSIPLAASALVRASSKSPAVPTARSKHTSTASSSSTQAPAGPAVVRHAHVNTTIMSLPLVPRWTAFRSISPVAIFTQPSVTPLRSVTMANPLLRRSFSSTTTTPLAAPFAMRLMGTCRPQTSLFHSTALPLRHLQLRLFGTGGISRTILASREAVANRNPTSPTAQNAFYQALLKANMPAIVIERHQLGQRVAPVLMIPVLTIPRPLCE